MVRIVRVFVCLALVATIIPLGCGEEELPDIEVPEARDRVVEILRLTNDQVEQLETGTGTLKLREDQVDILSDYVVELLDDLETWLDEAQWQEVKAILESMLEQGEVDLQTLGPVAEAISDCMTAMAEAELGVSVYTNLVQVPLSATDTLQEQSQLSDESQPSTAVLLYTPMDSSYGDKDFEEPRIIQPRHNGRGGKSISSVNHMDGALGVYSHSSLFSGVTTFGLQRILIQVPADNTDVTIKTTLKYVSGTNTGGLPSPMNFGSTAIATVTPYTYRPSEVLYKVLDHWWDWQDGVRLALFIVSAAYGGALVTTLHTAIELLWTGIDIVILDHGLSQDGKEEVITYSADSLGAGNYYFEVGFRARAEATLGSAGAYVLGMIPHIEVTQSVQEEPGVSSLGEALDNTDLAWTTGGDPTEWFAQTDTHYYGGSAAQSGDITHGKSTWLQTTVTGPGMLTFYWKVSSQSQPEGFWWGDLLRFYVNGVEQARISGSIDWHQKSYSLTSGPHTLEWRYTKDSSGDSGSDCGWVDKVTFTPSAPGALGEALDNTSLIWTTGGDPTEWFAQTDTYYYGGSAAQSGDITHGKSTWLQTTVTGPGMLTFYWKVSSQSQPEGFWWGDLLRFYVNGVEQARISGSIDWRQKSYSLTSGPHTLEWRYTKDSSGDSGSDCGWVDKVTFTPSG